MGSLIVKTHMITTTTTTTSTHYSADFQQSLEKPRISQTTMNSASRLSNPSSSRSKQARPIKSYSHPCLQYRNGSCKYGEMCIFAHDGAQDVGKLLYRKRGGILAEEQHYANYTTIGSYKLCRFFINGRTCRYGERCHFVHPTVEDVKGGLGANRDPRDGDGYRKGYDELEPKKIENLNSDTIHDQQKNVFWKTRLCRKWRAFGSCPYGSNCVYAHGEEEIRKVESFKKEIVALHKNGKESSEKRIIRPPFDQQEKSNEWDSIAKISRIYADWIESLPPIDVASGDKHLEY